MTREDFVRTYMSRSGMSDYRLDGERVIHAGGWVQLALPCSCGEDGCEGWAMVPPNSREWHLWQNGIDGALATGQEAMAADVAYMRSENATRDSGRLPKGENAEGG
jgi:hypothetical protein